MYFSYEEVYVLDPSSRKTSNDRKLFLTGLTGNCSMITDNDLNRNSLNSFGMIIK